MIDTLVEFIKHNVRLRFGNIFDLDVSKQAYNGSPMLHYEGRDIILNQKTHIEVVFVGESIVVLKLWDAEDRFNNHAISPNYIEELMLDISTSIDCPAREEIPY